MIGIFLLGNIKNINQKISNIKMKIKAQITVKSIRCSIQNLKCL